eukprot:6131575-Pleurochrysis_carterae.AAC.1
MEKMSRGTSLFASTYMIPTGDACASRMRIASAATRGTVFTASSAPTTRLTRVAARCVRRGWR